MSLFNLARSMGNTYQDVRNSLGVHMSPSGESCSMYRDPSNGDLIHVIWRDVDGDEVEVRATGECPKIAAPTTQEVAHR
jgi:hypothetical protein